MALNTGAAGWAEAAIEEACRRSEEWFRSLPAFAPRVNLRSVVGQRSPGLLSERDCVVAFARFLHDAGVAWDDIHHEVSISRWIFDEPHAAATAMSKNGLRRRVDLVLIKRDDLLTAELPAVGPPFSFEAFVEFGYLTDYWTQPNARIFNDDPVGGRNKVAADIEKIDRHLAAGACRVGYVVVFEECDYGFDPDFATSEESSGCRVRFVRSWDAH